MRARVIESKKHMTVFACHRIVFSREQWTDVPPGFEDEVRGHPLLEIEPETAEMVLPPAFVDDRHEMTRGRKKGGKA